MTFGLQDDSDWSGDDQDRDEDEDEDGKYGAEYDDNVDALAGLDLHNFISFSKGALKKQLENIQVSGEDKQFYLSKEVETHFKRVRLPAIQIDLVHVNDITLPSYDNVYPEQTVPKTSQKKSADDVSKTDDDPTMF